MLPKVYQLTVSTASYQTCLMHTICNTGIPTVVQNIKSLIYIQIGGDPTFKSPLPVCLHCSKFVIGRPLDLQLISNNPHDPACYTCHTY